MNHFEYFAQKAFQNDPVDWSPIVLALKAIQEDVQGLNFSDHHNNYNLMMAEIEAEYRVAIRDLANEKTYD